MYLLFLNRLLTDADKGSLHHNNRRIQQKLNLTALILGIKVAIKNSPSLYTPIAQQLKKFLDNLR